MPPWSGGAAVAFASAKGDYTYIYQPTPSLQVLQPSVLAMRL
jgi:hypothetical protein